MKQITMKRLTQTFLAASIAAAVAVVPRQAQAAKQWDAGDAINFVVDGDDDLLPASNNGDNGLQTKTFTVTTFSDKDHWIDPDESAPNNEGYPEEDLPDSDIEYYSDAPDPGGIEDNYDGSYTYTAPEVGGEYEVDFTGTDDSQTIGSGETGDRHDQDNTDNWWSEVDPAQ